MDRAHWKSPNFGGGGGRHNNPRNPRFRGEGGGGGGGFGTPRGFSPQWQQRSPSPYHHQHQQRFQHGGSSPFSPQPRGPYDPQFFNTSTPIHGSGGGRRPFFRGGGGRGRFNKRQGFGSFDRNSGGDNIENWISPEMWSDPWRHLIKSTTTTTADEDKTATFEAEVEGTTTKFADSDFSVSDSMNIQVDNEPGDAVDKSDLVGYVSSALI